MGPRVRELDEITVAGDGGNRVTVEYLFCVVLSQTTHSAFTSCFCLSAESDAKKYVYIIVGVDVNAVVFLCVVRLVFAPM